MEVALITGSPTWTDAQEVALVVQAYDAVVVGDAHGADVMAQQAAQAAGCLLKVFKADWKAFGKQAGALRNVQMVHHCVQLRADGCLVQCHAFWDGKSKVTLHCARAARDKGIPVSWHLIF